jgi:hypothetical protein
MIRVALRKLFLAWNAYGAGEERGFFGFVHTMKKKIL